MAYPSANMKNQRIAFYVLVLVGAVGIYTIMQALQVQRACFEKARKCESGRFSLTYEDHLWNATCTVNCLCEEHDSTLQTTTTFY